MTVDEWHAITLKLIDERMDEDGRSEARGKELRALADACEAFERVMYPLGDAVTPKPA